MCILFYITCSFVCSFTRAYIYLFNDIFIMINLTIVLYLLLTSHEITCLLAGVGFIDYERLRIGILSCDPTMHQSSSELRF